MKIFITILLLLPTISFSQETPWETKFNNYVKNLPEDVIQLLKKTDECNHWGGEEPYSEKRAKEIEAAVAKLKCDSLEKETLEIKDKYKKNKKVLTKIDKFSDLN